MANTLKFGNGQWATGNGTALAYNDENSNFKPLPFDFTRASSGTTVNQSGLIETVGSGIPRIDFLGNTQGALLLEPSRSNSITYSENVLLWSTSGTIIREDNVSISPNGKQTASTITSTNVSTFNSIRQNFSVSANSTCTASLFIKKVQTETNYLGLGIVFTGATTDVAYISFDSVNGIARNMDSRITAILNVVDYGTYWRLEATATDSESNTQVEMSVYTTLSTNGTTVSPGASSIRTIWGMQLELNSSYATSYIPTSGSAVTRVADVCTNGGNDQVINSTEGVLYAEIAALVTSGENRVITISDGSYNNSSRIQLYTNTNEIEMRTVVGGAVQALERVAISNTLNFNKIAYKYKANDFQLYVNGSKLRFDTSGSVSAAGTYNAINFDDGNGSAIFYGKARDIRVYNEALTDAELIALTS